MQDLQSTIHYPECKILYPRSVMRDPRSVIHNPRSMIHNPRSVIHNPRSAILDLQPTILDYDPKAATRGPESAIHYPIWDSEIHNPSGILIVSFSLTFLVCQPSVYFDCGLVLLSPGAYHHSIRCYVLWVWLRRVDAPDTQHLHACVQLRGNDVAENF